MQLWYSREHQKENVEEFAKIIRMFPNFSFFHPNYRKAPWHVKAVSQSGTEINLWPHLMKGNLTGYRAVVGRSAIIDLFKQVEDDDAQDPDEIMVVDDEC